jgi:hypothetical protein
MVKDRQRSWALFLALLVPVASSLLLAALPWEMLIDRPMPLARPWLYATAVVGAVAVLLLPLRWPWRILAALVYVPTVFVLLAFFNVVLVCLTHAKACP